jgi:hypothetical protein
MCSFSVIYRPIAPGRSFPATGLEFSMPDFTLQVSWRGAFPASPILSKDGHFLAGASIPEH